jgi:hypothetical protein
MPNILDDLFQWAAQQPAGNTITVRVATTTNEITRNNLVSYAEGFLNYHPGHSVGMFFVGPSFSSSNDGVVQYFSDRRYGPQGSFTTFPFDANNTDPLTVSITRAPIAATGYTITIKSSKWGFTENFTPTVDAGSNVIYGSVSGGLVTISLCNRSSQPVPR